MLALRVPGADTSDTDAVEALADAARAIMAQWSAGVAAGAPVLRPLPRQADAARTLRVSQPAISKMMRRREFVSLGRIEAAAAESLARCVARALVAGF